MTNKPDPSRDLSAYLKTLNESATPENAKLFKLKQERLILHDSLVKLDMSIIDLKTSLLHAESLADAIRQQEKLLDDLLGAPE